MDMITIGGFTYSDDMATVLAADTNISSLEEMERGVRYIGKGAFTGCENLRVVRIPETVIRIEDFAFRDCPNIHELYLPRDMEYISPLAFTFSPGFSEKFYINGVKTFFPKDAFSKYAYMIPQFVSEWSYADYGLTNDDMKDVKGWGGKVGMDIYVDEDELYRMAIEDDVFMTDEPCDLIEECELVELSDHQLMNAEQSFGVIIDETIRYWLKYYPWNCRPVDVIHEALYEALKQGYAESTNIEREDVDINCDLFYNVDEIIDCYCWRYVRSGYPVNKDSLKEIVRKSMSVLYRIGYSYGA